MFDKSVLRRIVLEYEDEDSTTEIGESAPNTARPPDTSKTIRPPDHARASPEKVRSARINLKSPAQSSPELKTRRSDPPIPTLRTSFTGSRPSFARKKSDGPG